MINEFKQEATNHMDNSINSYKKNLSSVRAGRASSNLLDQIKVETYGDFMPLNQLATINVQDSSMLIVQVWDKTNVDIIQKAISTSSLNLNPSSEGNTLKIPLPKLSHERRLELTKVCAEYAEDAKIAIRNIRRNILDKVKKHQKDGDISEDDQFQAGEEIQKITNKYTALIDDLLSHKKEEILAV